MKRLILAATLALLATGPALASGSESNAGGPAPFAMGEVLGTSTDTIQTALAAKGLEMRKYEREGGRIEIYAADAARVWEVKLDATTGAVTAIEIED